MFCVVDYIINTLAYFSFVVNGKFCGSSPALVIW